MIFLLLTVLIIPYLLIWLNEHKFIIRNSRFHGRCLKVSHLSCLTIDGEDQLSWGSKVYLHEKCIVIAPPLTSWSLTIPYAEIQFPRVSKGLISFCFPAKDDLHRFSLLTSPTDNNISADLLKLISINNSGVITC